MHTDKARIVFVHNPVGAELERQAKERYGDLVSFMLPEEAAHLAGSFDALMTRDVVLEQGILSGERLRWVHAQSHGFGQLLTEEMLAHQATLTNSRGCHSESVAEHLFAMLLTLTRRLHEYHDQQREHKWARLNMDSLFGKTMCVIGVGSIGREVAYRARAFGMRVMGVDPLNVACESLDALYSPEELENVLPEADVVSICVPYTEHTKNMFDEHRLGLLKPGAYLMNIARGAIVDESSLQLLLRSNRIAGAGFDVFAEEPLPSSSNLWDCPNMVLLPHSASRTALSRKRLTEFVLENIRRFLVNEPLINVVKPGVLS